MTARLPFLVASIVLAPALVLGVACSDDNGDGGATGDREQFERDVEERLSQIDEEIGDIENRIQEEGGNAGEDLEQRLDDLRDERSGLNDRLDDLRKASDEEWENVRDDIEGTLEDLDQRLEDF